MRSRHGRRATRRAIGWQWGTVALATAWLLAACAPAVTTQPAKVAPAQPAASAAAASPAEKPATGGEWDRLVAAAQAEGKVVVGGPPGDTFRAAALEFQKKHPQIAVEFTGGGGPDFIAKVLPERRAEQYLWDVLITGAQSGFTMRDEQAFDPLRPALVLPDVLDGSKWLGGFDDGFMDKDKQFIYAFTGFVFPAVQVNRDVIPESELSSVEQLLDPKWKGKISWNEPRVGSAGSAAAGYWLFLKGEDWVRQLFLQDVTITRDIRQQVEWLVQNRFPIAVAPDAIAVTQFRREGFGSKITPLAPDTPLGSYLIPGFGSAMLMNRAPHPNAAKVYLNWLLSQEGQSAWTATTDQNSRRLDVQGPPDTAPKPDRDYVVLHREEIAHNQSKAIELARSIFR